MLPRGPMSVEEQKNSIGADNEKMPPPKNPTTDVENPTTCNQGGSSSGSESVETPASKAERRRIIMRRLIKRLSAKNKAGQIDIPTPPADPSQLNKKGGDQETKSEIKQQGLI